MTSRKEGDVLVTKVHKTKGIGAKDGRNPVILCSQHIIADNYSYMQIRNS